MAHVRSQILLHGMIGGLAAGAVVALWFLAVDLATTEAFHTPVLLARTILGTEGDVGGSGRLALAYTVLHFSVFALLGVAMAGFLAAVDAAPGVRMGVLLGLVVLTSVYYVALLLTGANVLTVLPPIHVIGANLVGGVVGMAYLHRATHSPTGFGLGALRYHHLLAEGLVTGLIGALAVAVWFLLLDVVAGRPFYTPAALGSAFFLDAESPADVRVTAGLVGAYAIMHLAAFAIVGVIFTWAAEQLQRTPGLWLLFLMSFIVLEGVFLGTVATLGEWVMGAVSWWAVGLGNLIAVATMGWRVWVTHPVLGRQLEQVADTKV
jgi:hypothetical protein